MWIIIIWCLLRGYEREHWTLRERFWGKKVFMICPHLSSHLSDHMHNFNWHLPCPSHTHTHTHIHTHTRTGTRTHTWGDVKVDQSQQSAPMNKLLAPPPPPARLLAFSSRQVGCVWVQNLLDFSASSFLNPVSEPSRSCVPCALCSVHTHSHTCIYLSLFYEASTIEGDTVPSFLISMANEVGNDCGQNSDLHSLYRQQPPN